MNAGINVKGIIFNKKFNKIFLETGSNRYVILLVKCPLEEQIPLCLKQFKPAVHMDVKEYYNHISTTVNHFYEKLFLLKGLMNTATAKRIAEQRDVYMKSYILEFMKEWDGRR